MQHHKGQAAAKWLLRKQSGANIATGDVEGKEEKSKSVWDLTDIIFSQQALAKIDLENN